MPRIMAGEIYLYYERHGAGFPLILIRGFGSNADHWYSQVPAFSMHYETIVFDNRGVGRSDGPQGCYSIADMCDDTAALLDALGVARAHVLGISMGGMIAQEMALNHPDRVRGLVLACTHCGGGKAVMPGKEVMEVFHRFSRTASQEDAVKVAGCLFTERTMNEHFDIVETYRRVSSAHPVSADVLTKQFDAIQGHDTWARLPRIKCPTLVLTGAEDVLIPPINSRILAERIPGARLEILPGCGHQMMLEQARLFNDKVFDFLGSLE